MCVKITTSTVSTYDEATLLDRAPECSAQNTKILSCSIANSII